DRLFFAMEYLSGGDLYDYLDKNGRLDLSTTTDIKPDNILMDSVGHLKIADFGLALENMRGRKKAKEHAGTLGYIAPEFHPFPSPMLLGQRYNAAVDWWAFGVILYTMATGEFPFYCGNTSETLDILKKNGRVAVRWTEGETMELFNLLLKEPAMRLGRKGLIRSHSFFQSIDWEELEAGRVEPPFTLSTSHADRHRGYDGDQLNFQQKQKDESRSGESNNGKIHSNSFPG
ncbi:kinase C theta type-like, partial, partial [Pelobates cultripes]